ncbi:class I SAM-dependent methyltransferase [Pseudomonas sp. LPB0260]|uniref:class I SAM-dependent methyltransferase n=1 Tax=Pseudomonas sp. LPB0260 TaxID=2614442 RepID=UPI0015C2BA31|nr:class I SAM-dependent methyltransferase [Pseudomonas sp. LPB0260]QLC73795.1 class I SAM-dependent methyltransferase [Pseudomonas sp. LPB0260]QLC76569.1 class I SAM-dependent methyltransferase [Pseudomonas sp. LPB0260]
MSEVAELFGTGAAAYASYRPQYPDALFDWLAEHSPQRQRALDIACGNGQASRPLLRHFAQVLACDASLEQLRAGRDWQGIQLFAASAEALPLPSASLDLIVVAQALHWFAGPAFFAEVGRLLRPDGLFCAWCYGLMQVDSRLDALIEDFYGNTLAGYWLDGRASVDAGYRDIPLPFPRLEAPELALEATWNLGQLTGYLGTWSAVQRWQRKHGRDPVGALKPALQQAWGDPDQPRPIRWPLHLLAGIAR